MNQEDVSQVFQQYVYNHLQEKPIDFFSLLEKNPELRAVLQRKIDAYNRFQNLLCPQNKESSYAHLINQNVNGTRLLRLIGQGGSGAVFLGYQDALKRYVTVKFLKATRLTSELALERFRRESQIIAKIQHANINPVFDVGLFQDLHYIIAQYVDGISLETLVALCDDNTGRPPSLLEVQYKFRAMANEEAPDLVLRYPTYTDFVRALIAKIAGALEYLHKLHIIHRDIKPANILINTQGEPVLIDFGLSKDFNDWTQTQSGEYLGTPGYSAPEQFFGKQDEVDEQSDIYALGVTFYQLLTGRLPYEGNSFAEIVAHIKTKPPIDPLRRNPFLDPDLGYIVLKAIQYDKLKRYTTAAEFKKAIEQWSLSEKKTAARKYQLVTRCQYCAEWIDVDSITCCFCHKSVTKTAEVHQAPPVSLQRKLSNCAFCAELIPADSKKCPVCAEVLMAPRPIFREPAHVPETIAADVRGLRWAFFGVTGAIIMIAVPPYLAGLLSTKSNSDLPPAAVAIALKSTPPISAADLLSTTTTVPVFASEQQPPVMLNAPTKQRVSPQIFQSEPEPALVSDPATTPVQQAGSDPLAAAQLIDFETMLWNLDKVIKTGSADPNLFSSYFTNITTQLSAKPASGQDLYATELDAINNMAKNVLDLKQAGKGNSELAKKIAYARTRLAILKVALGQSEPIDPSIKPMAVGLVRFQKIRSDFENESNQRPWVYAKSPNVVARQALVHDMQKLFVPQGAEKARKALLATINDSLDVLQKFSKNQDAGFLHDSSGRTTDKIMKTAKQMGIQIAAADSGGPCSKFFDRLMGECKRYFP